MTNQDKIKQLKRMNKEMLQLIKSNKEEIEKMELEDKNDKPKKQRTFLFDLICDDLVDKITNNIKWFKAVDYNKKNGGGTISIHRLDFLDNKPSLNLSLSYHFGDYKNAKNDYYLYSNNNMCQERFEENRRRKYKTDKKNLLYYNFQYNKFKEIDYETNISSIH